VLYEIEAGEANHALDLWGDCPGSVVGRTEVATPDVGRDTAEGPLPVDPGGALLQEATVDVGAEDLDLPVADVRQDLAQPDRQRIGLFARTTGGAPDAQPLVSPGPRPDQGR